MDGQRHICGFGFALQTNQDEILCPGRERNTANLVSDINLEM